MLNQVAAAIERQDYQTAHRLLEEFAQQSPHNPWVPFYQARIQEASNQLEEAAHAYRQLLRATSNPKLAVQVRQGLQRIESMQKRQQQAIAQPPEDAPIEPGFLVLEGVTGDCRNTVIQNLARIMKLDAYTARMLLPQRGWRLYRTGGAAELQNCAEELQAAGVPVSWVSRSALQRVQVFRVDWFQSVSPKATVVCHNEQDQPGCLSFDWSEITQRVEGMLPVFEQVLTLGYRDRLERKEQTQDYIHCCDLHLPRRRSILRLQDTRYQFNQGVSVIPKALVSTHDRNTNRTHWNSLIDLLNRQLPEIPVWSDFTSFAETTADFSASLQRLNAHIDVLRNAESHWDPAFQLYSGLLLLRQSRTITPG